MVEPEENVEEAQPPEDEATPQATPQDTQSTVVELEGTLKALQDDYLRLRADFDNYRKRTQKEREELAERTKEALLCEILVLSDDLERVLAMREAEGTLDNFFTGIELTYRRFCALLEKEGIARIACEGEFNPALHECVMYEERDDVPEGTILEEVRGGYEKNGRVLRPARVKVARSSEV
ncbi:MAG: nucleotide exchange factor GrpE [Methermicoccaceae archaeon]